MTFKKSDLVYTDYSWKAIPGDDPRVSGEPDSTLLSRKEGYEVLYFVNKTMEKLGLQSVVSGQKIERMIREDVPSDIRRQDEIFQWIKDNY